MNCNDRHGTCVCELPNGWNTWGFRDQPSASGWVARARAHQLIAKELAR